MMKKTRMKKIVLNLVCLLIILFLGFCVYVYIESYKWRNAGHQVELLEDKIEKFETDPNIDDCYFIVSRSIGLNKYDQTLKFGKKCIELGINDTQGGTLINFWMAVAYKKKGNIKLSKHYLCKALILDKEGKLFEHKWIEKMEMEKIYKDLE